MIPDIGKQFFIHSPYSDTHYKGVVTEFTDWGILEVFLDSGNVYLCN